MERKCCVKIATYNIWNNEEQDKREKHILRELHMAEADIVGLQEVTDDFYEKVLAKDEIYPHSCFYAYAEENEGLAILSKFPLCEEYFMNKNEEDAYSNEHKWHKNIDNECTFTMGFGKKTRRTNCCNR